MPVIGGNQPTVQMTLPVPQPAPMKKPKKPAPAPQPVPQNNESEQQEVPQGMIPQPAPVPIPRAIILPWSPPPKEQGPVMRKRKYGRFDRGNQETTPDEWQKRLDWYAQVADAHRSIAEAAQSSNPDLAKVASKFHKRYSDLFHKTWYDSPWQGHKWTLYDPEVKANKTWSQSQINDLQKNVLRHEQAHMTRARLDIKGASDVAQGTTPRTGILKNKPVMRKRLKYSVESYQGEHTPPDSTSGAPLHDVTANGVYPEDVYSSEGLRYYGTGEDSMDREMHARIRRLRGNPKQMILIHRAVPTGLKGAKINRGDWVTLSREYARQHGRSALNGKYRIITKIANARDVFTNGDSWHEWGYYPQSNAPEQMSRRKYAADDGLDFGMDAMQPEGTEPTSSHSKPPTDPDQGRRRKQLLQQILDAAKKGHYDPAGMAPSDYIKDMETPEEPPPGGNVWIADPEDEEPKKMARAEPHQITAMINAVHQHPNDMLARHRLADALEQIGHPKSAIKGLRFDGPVWIGNSPKGLLNAIPVASKKLLEATDSWGRPKINNFYHATSRSSRGGAHSVRVSGRMQTWKTRPDEFRVPWKFGLYQNGEINHRNFREWLVSDPTEEPS